MMNASASYKSGGRGRRGRAAATKSAMIYKELAEQMTRNSDWERVAEYCLKSANSFEVALREVERRNMAKRAVTAYYTAAQIASDKRDYEGAYRLCQRAVEFSTGMGRWSPADEARRLLVTIESEMRNA
jgi:hypothetical protein